MERFIGNCRLPAQIVTFPHGLPSTPLNTMVLLKCVTADKGYSAEDLVVLDPDQFIQRINPTNIEVRLATRLKVRHKNTSRWHNINPIKWALQVQAFVETLKKKRRK